MSGLDQPDSPDHREVVFRALNGLGGLPGVDQLRSLPDDDLMDVLLDQRRTLDFEVWIECVATLAQHRFEDLIRVICQQEYLILNPGKVADLALARFVALLRLNRRVRPCSRWIPELLQGTIAWARLRPRFCAFPSTEARTPDEKTRSALSQMINELDTRSRKIVHLSWVDRMKPDQVADATRLPLGAVESVLAGVLGSLRNITAGGEHLPTGEAMPPEARKPLDREAEDGHEQ